MMNRHLILSFKLVLPLGLGLALASLALSGLSGQRAQANGTCQRYVFTGGDDTTDCSNPASPCKSIQYALGKASTNDTVCVAGDKDVPGPTVYPGSVVITRQVALDGSWLASGLPGSYTIQHVECDPNKVWLDGQWAGTVMTLTSTAGKAEVHCFTITRGRTGYCGGGIYAEYNAVSIRENIITNNVAISSGSGGGICAGSDGVGIVIERNTIISNSAYNGAAAMLIGLDGFSLNFNRIVENDSTAPGYGSAIDLNHANAYLFGNQIVDNKTGATVYLHSSLPATYILRAINNLVSGNEGDGFIGFGNRMELLHNTIVSNTMYGVWGNYTATITLTNNLIAYNDTGVGGTTNSTLTGTHNLFWGNGSDPFTGTAAVLGNPRLRADGYHLMAGSAAIDAGTPVSLDIDIDGQLRVLPLDIGADECDWYIYLPLVRRD